MENHQELTCIFHNVTTLSTRTGAVYKVYFDGNGNPVKYTKGNDITEQAECDRRKECTVYELKDENIYVIIRSLGGSYIGGDICVAIDKNTGETLKVWFGE